jgi:hypothetical protein
MGSYLETEGVHVKEPLKRECLHVAGTRVKRSIQKVLYFFLKKYIWRFDFFSRDLDFIMHFYI